MPDSMRIAFFGTSVSSLCWIGVGTYYAGVVRALHLRYVDAPDWALRPAS